MVGEGEDLTCACRGVGGNPPANVTWYKDDGTTYVENAVLKLINVNKINNCTYKCVVQSYTLKDENSIEVIVYRKYILKLKHILFKYVLKYILLMKSAYTPSFFQPR